MLNSVKDLKELSSGNLVIHMEGGKVVSHEPHELSQTNHPITVDHDDEYIQFKVMTKPASEGGSGCQLTDLVEVALYQIKFFQAKFPCRENAMTITKLEEALMWQHKRTNDRIVRGVEGKDEK